ncbi:hypothetical protein IAR55_002044 [Kwoniella newhampshirensis]|uniref:BTB domain-containing protein n=1 Tax=Kwoniella newhampshirensis TaxID=1651941 RepID=A0AAW0Z0J4_9TREE
MLPPDMAAGGKDSSAITDEKWNDGDADCVLVSWDQVRFHVPKYHLQSASVGFRSTLETATCSGTTPELHLTDPDCESSKIVRQFLNLTDGSWSPPSHKPDYDSLENLLRFTDKWDCPSARRTVLQSLYAHYRPHESSADMRPFVLAARYGEVEICTEAFNYVDHTWRIKEGPPSTEVQSKFSILDPKGWSLDLHCRMPPVYTWALLRLMEPYSAQVQPTRKEIPDLKRRFRKLVELGNKELSPNHTESLDSASSVNLPAKEGEGLSFYVDGVL